MHLFFSLSISGFVVATARKKRRSAAGVTYPGVAMDSETPGSDTQTILFGTLRGEGAEAGLSRYRDSVAASAKAHGGQLHGFAVDAVVMVFREPREALECAAEIQRTQSSASGDPGALRFAFGLQRGSVEFVNGRPRGAAFEVASRLERLSDPGGVCVSGSVRNELLEKTNLNTIDVGWREVEEGRAPIAVQNARAALQA